MVPKLMIARARGALFSWLVEIGLVCKPEVAYNTHFLFQFGSFCSNSSVCGLIAPFSLKLAFQSSLFHVLMDLGVHLLCHRFSRFHFCLNVGKGRFKV